MAAEADFSIGEIWETLWFGAGPAAFAVLYGLFAKLEDMASPQAKQDIAAWLKRAEIPGTLVNWPSQFAALFDRVFGERHLTWRCFLRSCVASLAAVAVMFAIWAVLRPDDAADLLREVGLKEDVRRLRGHVSYTTVTAVIIGTALSLNVVPDYIALLQSRFAIHIMTETRSKIVILLAVSINAPASMLIYLISGQIIVSLLVVLSGLYLTWDVSVYDLWLAVLSGFDTMRGFLVGGIALDVTSPIGIPFGVFLYSSLFTSVWVWLYALAAGAIRLALTFQPVLRLLKWFLDIDEKPIRSIGVLVGLIGAVFWWGLVLIAVPEG